VVRIAGYYRGNTDIWCIEKGVDADYAGYSSGNNQFCPGSDTSSDGRVHFGGNVLHTLYSNHRGSSQGVWLEESIFHNGVRNSLCNSLGRGCFETVNVSHINESAFADIGLISLTLYRSHIIRKTKQNKRENDQIWKKEGLDDKEYLNQIANEIKLEQSHSLAKTVLRDGCFWVCPTRKTNKEEELSPLSFYKGDWRGLALLYGVTISISLHRYFSITNLWRDYCKDLGWKSFSLGKFELSDLAYYRSYGSLLHLWGLSETAVFFLDETRDALERNLKKDEYQMLNQKMGEWKKRHKEEQTTTEKEFMDFA
jgi:hypothetical protein